jgi:hypothetical protein
MPMFMPDHSSAVTTVLVAVALSPAPQSKYNLRG